MNVRQLIELLEQADAGQEVRIATQPSYPIATHIAGVYDAAKAWYEVETCPEHGLEKCDGCEWDGESDRPSPILWLVEGSQLDDPYIVPSEAFTDCARA